VDRDNPVWGMHIFQTFSGYLFLIGVAVHIVTDVHCLARVLLKMGFIACRYQLFTAEFN
jgi:hypothetical protein